ncbi:unnamed protein product [Thelazia callipaeda]|uniref:C2H2-type domain-containing protein n=1 Tax=Thelazia callipaeda TaxID=103827 RepID=A0A0N5D1I9_THECL|nr:unnamed protein product [Thelazia callipaeda]
MERMEYLNAFSSFSSRNLWQQPNWTSGQQLLPTQVIGTEQGRTDSNMNGVMPGPSNHLLKNAEQIFTNDLLSLSTPTAHQRMQQYPFFVGTLNLPIPPVIYGYAPPVMAGINSHTMVSCCHPTPFPLLTRLLNVKDIGEKKTLEVAQKENFHKQHLRLDSTKLLPPHVQDYLQSILAIRKRQSSEFPQVEQEVPGVSELLTVKRPKVNVIIHSETKHLQVPSCPDGKSAMKEVEIKQGEISGTVNIKYGLQDTYNSYGDSESIRDEVNQEMQYVDVETVDDKSNAKEQKKALIEFYRKVKAIRLSYGVEDKLICQMCEQKVSNSDSLILMHLYGHSEVMPYRCKICGAGEWQLDRIYAHITREHPKMDPLITYENRRNMPQLISLLRKCFARNIAKSRPAYSSVIDRICEEAQKRLSQKVTCLICVKNVIARRNSLIRHAQSHLHHKCRICGLMMFNDGSVSKHIIKEHGIQNPHSGVHYNPCVTTSERTEMALTTCFSDLLR